MAVYHLHSIVDWIKKEAAEQFETFRSFMPWKYILQSIISLTGRCLENKFLWEEIHLEMEMKLCKVNGNGVEAVYY